MGEQMRVPLQEWISAQTVEDKMLWKGAFGHQMVFLRDTLTPVVGSGLGYEQVRDHVAFVISTHRSKSIKLPVYDGGRGGALLSLGEAQGEGVRIQIQTEWCDLVASARPGDTYVYLQVHDSLSHQGSHDAARLGKASVAQLIGWLQAWQLNAPGQPDATMLAEGLAARLSALPCTNPQTIPGLGTGACLIHCNACKAAEAAGRLAAILRAAEPAVLRPAGEVSDG